MEEVEEEIGGEVGTESFDFGGEDEEMVVGPFAEVE